MLEQGGRHPDDVRAEARPGAPREPLWRDVVGEVLREERQTKARTLQDVADAARISMPYLSEIERGRKEASSEVLAAATRALGISMTELLVRVQSRLAEYEHTAEYGRSAAARVAYASQNSSYGRAASAASSYARAAGTARGVRNRDALCLAA